MLKARRIYTLSGGAFDRCSHTYIHICITKLCHRLIPSILRADTNTTNTTSISLAHCIIFINPWCCPLGDWSARELSGDYLHVSINSWYCIFMDTNTHPHTSFSSHIIMHCVYDGIMITDLSCTRHICAYTHAILIVSLCKYIENVCWHKTPIKSHTHTHIKIYWSRILIPHSVARHFRFVLYTRSKCLSALTLVWTLCVSQASRWPNIWVCVFSPTHAITSVRKPPGPGHYNFVCSKYTINWPLARLGCDTRSVDAKLVDREKRPLATIAEAWNKVNTCRRRIVLQ